MLKKVVEHNIMHNKIRLLSTILCFHFSIISPLSLFFLVPPFYFSFSLFSSPVFIFHENYSHLLELPLSTALDVFTIILKVLYKNHYSTYILRFFCLVKISINLEPIVFYILRKIHIGQVMILGNFIFRLKS